MHQITWLATSDEPFVESDSQAVQRTMTRNNLHNIGLASHNYHDVYESFPPGGLFTEDGLPLHSWQTHLLGYFDASPLRDIDMTRPWTDPIHGDVFRTRMKVFEIPRMRLDHTNEAGYALSHYAANERLFWPDSATQMGDVTDGTAETIMAGEVNANFRAWGDPVNWRDPALGINQSPDGFGSPFTGGAFFLLCNGRVRFVSEEIDPEVLQAISTPAGGEPVEEF